MEELSADEAVSIKRHPMDWRIGSCSAEYIHGLRWDNISGGVNVRTRTFLYGYVFCDVIEGEVGHNCRHGIGPHEIKVCIIKKYTKKSVYNSLLEQVGPKPPH